MEEELKNYNMTVEDGLHIFSPTADVLHDFDNFLIKVEDIAGRERGVVKVILPKELWVSTFSGAQDLKLMNLR